MYKSNKGFTLVELLVVIAIIGILASVVLVSLNSARQKARDARRISDLHQISLALENYYDAAKGIDGGGTTQAYPTALTTLVPTYLATEPKDPTTSASYGYNSAGCPTANQRYALLATLENFHTALTSDIDGTVCTLACGTAANGDGQNERAYCIQP